VDRPGWRLKAFASKAAQAFASSRVPETRAGGLAAMPPPAWTFLTGPLSQVSSTELRRKGAQPGKAVAKKPQSGVANSSKSATRLGPGARRKSARPVPEPEQAASSGLRTGTRGDKAIATAKSQGT
jgi:hypothetical protein